MNDSMKGFLTNELKVLCSIPSETFAEQALVAHVKKRLLGLKGVRIREHSDGLVVDFPRRFSASPKRPHLCLVGHADVVPKHFEPYTSPSGSKLHGAGASDMKAALAVFVPLIEHYAELPEPSKNLSFVLYSREEGTTLQQNGLYALIERFQKFFKSIDVAIVGEPTNNNLQLGCLGSLHAELTFRGKAAHSARPWDGQNALYEAVPFLSKVRRLKPKKATLFGVDFYEVIVVTELVSAKGKTTVSDWVRCHVNYRFAPNKSIAEAKRYFVSTMESMGVRRRWVSILDVAYAGGVVESEALLSVLKAIQKPTEAKQAWTDVAQLSRLGVPAFNYGPGLTAQAHKPNEYARPADLLAYYRSLLRLL